jgi:hypothetical protein
LSGYLSRELLNRLKDVDNRHCAYCHTKEVSAGHPMTIDHIVPRSQGGMTIFENLCFACRSCNEFKGGQTKRQDPLTGEIVSLFNPRYHNWNEHFIWDESGIVLLGLTAIGRATIVALRMNNSVIVAARRRWVSVGWHP